MAKKKNNRKITTIITIIILILIGIFFSKSIFSGLNKAVSFVNFRLVNTKTMISKGFGIYEKKLAYIDNVEGNLKKINELEQEIELLKAQKADFDNVVAENLELKKILDLANNNLDSYIVSQVLLIEAFQNDDVIYINRGSKDGVEEDLPVMLDGELIGKVNKVAEDYSEVYLLSNPNFRLSVEINDNILGILRGKGNSEFVINNFNIENADKISRFNLTTSGISKQYPKGLKIGSYVVDNKIDLTESKELNFKLKFKISDLNNLVVYKYDKTKLNLINRIERERGV